MGTLYIEGEGLDEDEGDGEDIGFKLQERQPRGTPAVEVDGRRMTY